MLPPLIKELIENLSSLPGLGPKSARRIVFFILENKMELAESLSNSIIQAKRETKFCEICGCLSQEDICIICTDPYRDKSIICVVETFTDQIILENVGCFNGLYHILGGTISPLDGRGPQSLTIDKLIERIKLNTVNEILIATNPTPEGNVTSLYLNDILSEYDINISQLSRGIPVGSDLDLLDSETIKLAISGRRNIKNKH